MRETNTRYNLSGAVMLTLCALIWGTAFIAQSLGARSVGPLTFNFSRAFLATVFLAACCLVSDRLSGRPFSLWGPAGPERRRLFKSGLKLGLTLSLAIFFQQLGVAYTTVGKSGFITALYIVFVPVLNRLFLKRPIGLLQLAGVALATCGMYFICIDASLDINKGDIYMLLAALFFAAQIICVESTSQGADSLRLALAQFAVCCATSGLFMLIFETPSLDGILSCWQPVAYAGIMSNGVAYTLQIAGQKQVNPVLASMLMSLESVFALASGCLFLGQAMSVREICGCLLVFTAIILAQLPSSSLKLKKS